jgi:hypothetical protein
LRDIGRAALPALDLDGRHPGAQETVKWVTETSIKARMGGKGNKAGATFTFP